MILAKDTVPGKCYRRTRGAAKGVFYTRPARSAEAHAAKLKKKGTSVMGNEMSLLLSWREDKSLILLRRHNRGTDPFSGNRFEVKTWILVDPDLRLRELKAKPGYK